MWAVSAERVNHLDELAQRGCSWTWFFRNNDFSLSAYELTTSSYSWNKLITMSCKMHSVFFESDSKLNSAWCWRHGNINFSAVHIFARVSLEWMKRKERRFIFCEVGKIDKVSATKHDISFWFCRFQILHLIENCKQSHSRKIADAKVKRLDVFNHQQLEHTLLIQHCCRSFNL